METDKFFCLMLFFRAHEIWRDEEEQLRLRNLTGNEWINAYNRVYEDSLTALDAYANTKCPASQLVSAPTREKLNQEIDQMIANYQNQAWLEENLYPYL